MAGRILEERRFTHAVVAEVIAELHKRILDATQAAIDKALTQRIRGTFDSNKSYGACDIVAKDGGSFIARKDNPGPCPGPGWQPDEGGRSLRQSDDRPKPALADRLHLSKGHRLGLVLSVHRAR